MKTALLFLFISIVFLALIYSRVDVWFGPSTIDIHVHDRLAMRSQFLAQLVVKLIESFASFAC